MLFYSHLKENFIYSRWEFYSKRRHLLKLFLICYILLVSHIILLVEYIDVDLYFDCPVVTKEEAIAVIPFIRCNSSNMDYMGEDHHQYLFRHVFYENKLFELFDLHQFSEANLIRFAVLIQLKYSMLFVLLIEFLNIFENIVRKELIRMAKVKVKQSDKQMNLCTIAFHSIVRIDRMDNYDFSYKKTNFISVREIVKKMCRGKICFIEDSTYNTIIKYSSRAYIDALFCIFNHIFVSMQRSRQNILFFSVDINNDKDKMTFCIEVITHLRRRIALYDSVYLKYGTLLARKYLDNGRVYELRKKVEPLLRCQKYPFLLQTPHSSGNLSMKKTNPEFIEMLLSDYIKRSPSSWVWINSELQLRQPLLKQEIFRFLGVPLIELDLQFILETKPPSTKSKFKVMIIYDESFLRGDKFFDYLKLFSEQILIIGHSLSPFRIDSRIKYIGRKPQAIDVLNCITDLMSEPYDVMNGTRQNDLPNINYDDDNFLGEDKMLKWLKRKEKQRSNPGKL